MLYEDVTDYFDVRIKYKDLPSLNSMHDKFRQKYCKFDELTESRENKSLDAIVEYKNKLQENVDLNNSESAHISKTIIKDLEINDKVGNAVESQNSRNFINILHISDIHMVAHDDSHSVVLENIIHKMITQISSDFKEKIDFICVTGDIAYSSNKNQYENFEKLFIDKIKYLFEKNVIVSERILIVPGNHDINRDLIDDDFQRNEWENDNDISNMMQKSISMINGDTGKSWNDKILKKLTFYKNFERKYIVNKIYEEGKTGFSYHKQYNINNINIGFTGINSAWSYGKESIKDGDKIFGGYEQFNQISREYKDSLSKSDVNMLLVHHPCELLEDKLSNSMLNNYNYVLCGHTHKPNMENDKLRGKAEVITGGSIFYKGSDKDKQPNRFHIIKLNKVITPEVTFMNDSITYYVWDENEDEWSKDISTRQLKKGNGTISCVHKL